MSTIIAATATILFLVVIVGLLKRHEERTGLPHLPFGADAAQDADLRRVLHDLDGHRAA